LTYIRPILPFLILLLLWGIYRQRQTGRRIWLWFGVGGLLLVSMPPVTKLSAYTLERSYPVTSFPVGEADAIVVLSGNSYSPDPPQPKIVAGQSTYIRCRYAAWLYRNWRPLPIIVSGGRYGDEVQAGIMKNVLVAEGIPPAMIWLDSNSFSTYESALHTAALLREKGIRRIALVTEAYHMLRSEKCFRKQGIEITPAPCAYRSRTFRHGWSALLPDPDAILHNEDILHEWLGLAWYKLSGRI
jgi:uncharacterized SAM-binding protein YcdF (DUF218 family)